MLLKGPVLMFAAAVLLPITLPAAQSASGVPFPEQRQPVVDVRDFGAKGDGSTDDTQAIQDALDSMTGGGTLYFPAGKYVHTAVLTVGNDKTVLWGYAGAELHASNVEKQSVMLTGDSTAICGFLLTSPATVRKTTLAHQRIVLNGSDGSAVVDNHVIGGSAGGIFAYGASNYLIAHNTVERTMADTIHNTNRSHHGRILYNHVIDGGDDGVAAVGYNGANPHDLYVEGNVVDGGKARGLTAAGTENISFIRNAVQDKEAAGLYIASESSYNTTGNRNVVARCNTLFRNNRKNIGHGNVLVWVASASCGGEIDGISRDNNDILIVGNRAVAAYATSLAKQIQVRPEECNHNVVLTGNFTSTDTADAGGLRDTLLALGAGQRSRVDTVAGLDAVPETDPGILAVRNIGQAVRNRLYRIDGRPVANGSLRECGIYLMQTARGVSRLIVVE